MNTSKASRRNLAISVLMPAHNSEKTIRRAIKSTLNSLGTDSELLICLDGCTDGTARVVESFKDYRIKVFQSDQSHGVAQSLNKLLTLSSKQYIARMDSDDICIRGRFRRQLKKIKKLDVDFVFGNAIAFSFENNKLALFPQMPLRLTPEQCNQALLLGCPLVHSTMFAKKQSLIELGGYRNLAAEDYDLWLRAASGDQKIYRSSCYEVLYRRHGAQISSQEIWKSRVQSEIELLHSAKALANKLGINRLENAADILELNSTAFQFISTTLGKCSFAILRLSGVRKFLGL